MYLQSVTTIVVDSRRLLNWLAELICTVLDMVETSDVHEILWNFLRDE